MIKKHCSSCNRNTWHNPLAKKKDEEQKYRCTFCGAPVSTNMAKRDYQEALRKKQALKPQ
jgi:DNA-directed RNA polymerase subunit RPC12/RpoP